jgi:Reverse transcriptase (RNA-dependent DNA polymerase)
MNGRNSTMNGYGQFSNTTAITRSSWVNRAKKKRMKESGGPTSKVKPRHESSQGSTSPADPKKDLKKDPPVVGSLRRHQRVWMTTILVPFATVILTWIVAGVMVAPSNHQTLCDARMRLERQLETIEQDWMRKEIERMLSEGVVEFLGVGLDKPPSIVYVNPIFVVPKPGPKLFRFICDMRLVNEGLDPPRFKLENVDTMLRMSGKNWFAATIDLSQAFYHLHIAEESRKYFGFQFEGNFYRFTCLPFGCSISPYAFTRVMEVAVRDLRKRGVSLSWYIDDLVVLGATKEECASALALVLQRFEELGLVVNPNKGSGPIPVQEFDFLGLRINLKTGRVSIPDAKREKLIREVERLLGVASPTYRDMASVAGKLLAVSRAFPVIRMYARELYDCVSCVSKLHRRWDSTDRLSVQAIEDLRWVAEQLKKAPPAAFAWRPSRISTLTADASGFGWGGHLDPVTAAQLRLPSARGSFDQKELYTPDGREVHIAIKEAYALLYSLQSFAKELRGRTISLRTDNMWVKAELKKFRGQNKLLFSLIRQIYELCLQNDIVVYTTLWVSTTDNVVADRLSRNIDDSDVRLHPEIFSQLNSTLGPFDVDCMATMKNTQLPTYMSWLKDPHCLAWDCFTVDWAKFDHPYVFPPVKQVHRVLRHIIECKVRATVVVPDTQAEWFPLLQRVAVASVPLGSAVDCCSAALDKARPTWFERRWNLIAVTVDGNLAQLGN